LEEAKKTRFRNMHDCFTRDLKDGARPIDPKPTVLVCPCDGIVGASDEVEGTTLYQAKGFPYTLRDLFGDSELVHRYRDSYYVTLRITASMYHRFHAPHDCRVKQVTYTSGDIWNVNPIALRRIEKLFCSSTADPISFPVMYPSLKARR
jgi:phosphatidylserine decarboxylase